MEQTRLQPEPFHVEFRRTVDGRLAELVSADPASPRILTRAIRHALLAPGKRFRPLLTLTVADALGGRSREALDPACAVEMVHTASLIVDDLPFMDDAAQRRGRPTCHQAFGTDVAMLASVALLGRAFAVLADAPGLDATQRVQLTRLLSRSIAGGGIVAGQLRDLRQAHLRRLDLEQLERMAREKTATLFVGAAEAGAVVAGATDERVGIVRDYASSLGLYFQVLDDLVDTEGCEVRSGKDVGKDLEKGTFVCLLGVDGARRRAEEFSDEAVAAADRLGPAGEPLIRIVRLLARAAADRTRAVRS